jgi:uncharacterized repeat protein (TIGR02543 family)
MKMSEAKSNLAVINNIGVPERPGYTFIGWNTAADGSGTAPAGGASTEKASVNTTLYAQWAINSYSVTFDPQGGSKTSPVIFTIEKSATIPSESSRPGFTFVGWNTTADGSGMNYSSSQTDLDFSGDTTLFAQWKANSIVVSFDTQGGSTVSPGTFVTGSTLALPFAPTRSGFTFAGWFTSASGGTLLVDGYTPTETSALTVYAQWTENTYTVTYNLNGGSAPSAPATSRIQNRIDPSVEPKDWFERESELPAFLQTAQEFGEKEAVATQKYVAKKSSRPIFVGVGALALVAIFSIYTLSSSDAVNGAETMAPAETIATSTSASPDTTESSSATSTNQSEQVVAGNSQELDFSDFTPRDVASVVVGDGVDIQWTAPLDITRLIGYEVSVKKTGTQEWIVISSVTTEQTKISVDLVYLGVTSRYKVASILENGKLIFSKQILTIDGEPELLSSSN